METEGSTLTAMPAIESMLKRKGNSMIDLRNTRKVYTFHVNGHTFTVAAESKLDAMVRANGRLFKLGNFYGVSDFYGWADGPNAFTFRAMFGAWD